MENSPKLVGIMPTFRDLFPNVGAIGEKQIIKIIKDLYLDDCILILSKLSRHYFKYYIIRNNDVDGFSIYRQHCFELLDKKIISHIESTESNHSKKYSIIFPELSILHLIKLCLKYCKKDGHTEGNQFEQETLYGLGKALLIVNALMSDSQTKGSDGSGRPNEQMLVNFTKQLIADHHFVPMQKFYQNYFLFNKFLKNYQSDFDIEKVFDEKYHVNVREYFAFMFLVYSQFLVNNTAAGDSEMPYFDLEVALRDVKRKFTPDLLKDLLINGVNYKKVDESFFNFFAIAKKPLIKLSKNVVIPLSFKHFILGITDSVYFDINDFLNEKQSKLFSTFFGYAIEDYFKDIVLNINKDSVFSFDYKKDGKNIMTSDAIINIGDSLLMFECKKRQFHTLDFLKNGNKDKYFERLNEFFYKPLSQLGDRISDFRKGMYDIKGVAKDALIYPIVVGPSMPPLFSGAWDMFNLDIYIIPDNIKNDKNIAHPEFIDFVELECIEEYLRLNPSVSFIDLIKIKRGDPSYRNSNWMIILQNHGFDLVNHRLQDEYQVESAKFGELLFD